MCGQTMDDDNILAHKSQRFTPTRQKHAIKKHAKPTQSFNGALIY